MGRERPIPVAPCYKLYSRLARVSALMQAVRSPLASRPAHGQRHPAVVERILRESVRGRMIADVPVGAFLSGGIDSSTVVALMQAQSSLKVRTLGLRRGAARQEGCHSPRDRSRRAICLLPAGCRRCVPLTRMVRRAVRGFLADPDLPRVRDDPQTRHRRAVWRRWRRAFCGLSALPHQ
jgi:hypothetical protein